MSDLWASRRRSQSATRCLMPSWRAFPPINLMHYTELVGKPFGIYDSRELARLESCHSIASGYEHFSACGIVSDSLVYEYD